MTTKVQENKSKHKITLFNLNRTKQCPIFRHRLPSTKRQTDIQHKYYIQHDNDDISSQCNVRGFCSGAFLAEIEFGIALRSVFIVILLYINYVCLFVALLKATYAENVYIVLSCPNWKAFIYFIFCVWDLAYAVEVSQRLELVESLPTRHQKTNEVNASHRWTWFWVLLNTIKYLGSWSFPVV